MNVNDDQIGQARAANEAAQKIRDDVIDEGRLKIKQAGWSAEQAHAWVCERIGEIQAELDRQIGVLRATWDGSSEHQGDG